jgi:diguanylate cyclase (GGDEF)-like protein/PAS domain S-box-containing protein
MAVGTIRVLLVDADAERAVALRRLLEGDASADFDLVRTTRLDDAVGALSREAFDVVLADLTVDDSDGLPTLAILLTYAEAAPIIVLSEHAADPTPLRALQQGATDHLPRDQLYAMPVVRTIRYAVERHQAEAALRESERRYRTLFQQSRDAIYMADGAGRIVEVNRAALELFGYRAEELVGRPIASLFADALEYEQLSGEVGRAGSVREVEVRLQTQDGRELWCLVAAAERRGASGESVGSQGILHDITERKRSELRLEHDALHDALTDLPNRALFMDRLEQAVRRSEREEKPSFALLFIDLDRFKAVNDSLGHAEGDRIIQQAAGRLRSCIRRHDTVARVGGDEFVVLLDGIDSVKEAIQAAERVTDVLGGPYRVKGREFIITASVGITWPTERRSPADALLREADLAMYRAKLQGGDRHELFGPELYQAAVSQLEVESDLRRALSGDELVLVYQPVLSFATGRVSGFEALARWDHPRRGRLAPAQFIPLAEESGLIVPLGLWAIRAAVRQLREWRASHPEAATAAVYINLSSRQFMERDLVAQIRDIVDQEGVAAPGVRLEVTENALMHEPDQAAQKLMSLREAGFGICLDDFGTGYSSLAYLRRFPLDYLKVDRSFVGRIEHSPRDLELVATIIGLARNLGIHSIIEGVETTAQLERLRRLRPQEVQGFLFSHPVEPAAAAAFFGTTRPELGPGSESLGTRLARRLRWTAGGVKA